MLTIPFNPPFVVGKSHSILRCWSFPLNSFFTFTESMSSDRILITFLNPHSSNPRSGHYLLESRTCQRTSYRRIQVCSRFSCDGFLTAGQEFQGNTIPLLRGCNFGSLSGKRSPRSNALNLTNGSRQTTRKGVEHHSDVLQIRACCTKLCIQIAWSYDEAG